MTHAIALTFAILLFLVFLMFTIILSMVLTTKKPLREGQRKVEMRLPDAEEPETYGWEGLLESATAKSKKPERSRSFLKSAFSILIILVGILLIGTAIANILSNNAGDLFGSSGEMNASGENVTQEVGETGVPAQETELQNETASQGAAGPFPSVMEQFNVSQINFSSLNFSAPPAVLMPNANHGYAAGMFIGTILVIILIIRYVRRRRKLTNRASATAGKILKDKEKKRREERGESSFRQYFIPLLILAITLILAGGLLYVARSRIAEFLNLV